MAEAREPTASDTDLDQLEAELSALEVELAFEDGRLRGREHLVAAQRTALVDRARWLDQRERTLAALAQRHGLALPQGLGSGLALNEVDVEGYVARSATLHLGRAAMLAVRQEMLSRRGQQLQARRDEIASYEEAFGRAEVRLVARERLLAQATTDLARQSGRQDGPRAPSANATADLRKPAAAAAAAVTPAAPGAVANAAKVASREPVLPADDGRTAQMKNSPRIQPVTPEPGKPAPTFRATTRTPPPVTSTPETTPQAVVTVVAADHDADDPRLRHSETQALSPARRAAPEPPAPRALATPRRRPRSTPVPQLDARVDAGTAAAADVPDDLPDALPAPPDRVRHVTNPFMAVLKLDERSLQRHQIEFDRSGRTVLVSFSGVAPALGDLPVFRYRSREGDEAEFAVGLRRVLPEASRGSVAILSAAQWSVEQLDAFDRALLQLM